MDFSCTSYCTCVCVGGGGGGIGEEGVGAEHEVSGQSQLYSTDVRINQTKYFSTFKK